MSARCPYCTREWSGLAEAHCRALVDGGHCCAHFTTTSAADAHWPRGKHVAPSEVATLTQDEKGRWHKRGPEGGFQFFSKEVEV